ncbi:MAG: hypothetical protein IJS53_00835 [Clostridia bacterium]|nr:hypothetical protein [Clostridia bacterium]
MDEMVKAFLEENTVILHQRLLDQLGLFDYEKEYAPVEMGYYEAKQNGFPLTDAINGEIRFFRNGRRIYPKITETEYEKLLVIAQDMERAKNEKLPSSENDASHETIIEAKNTSKKCFGSTFMTVLAYTTWGIGLVLSILLSLNNLILFVLYALAFFMSGASFFCMAGLLANVQRIANAVQCFEMKEDDR